MAPGICLLGCILGLIVFDVQDVHVAGIVLVHENSAKYVDYCSATKSINFLCISPLMALLVRFVLMKYEEC